MATTLTKVSAGKHHLVYRITGAHAVAATRTNALIVADMVDGPLKTAWSRTYVTNGVSVLSAEQQALMGRLSPNFCSVEILIDVQPVDVATSIAPQALITDTAGKAGLSVIAGDVAASTTGWLYLIHDHTAIQ